MRAISFRKIRGKVVFRNRVFRYIGLKVVFFVLGWDVMGGLRIYGGRKAFLLFK